MSMPSVGPIVLAIFSLACLWILFNSPFLTKADNRILIVVPGGGLLKDGTLPPHSLGRMDRAVELFFQYQNSKLIPSIVALSAGTPHKPNPLDSNGFEIYESSSAMAYLLTKGIPSNFLFEEKISLDTIGNVFHR
jgi:uncharacterized SAM-binding protein YcdF (DUF218 family)